MYEERIQVEQGQRLTLAKMNKDVVVSCWDKAEVLVRLREGEEKDLTVEATESGPSVSSRESCLIKVPALLPVTVLHVRGNLKAVGLADLNVEQVRGNLKLDDVKAAVVAEVYGNLSVKGAESLRLVGTIYGNAGIKAAQAVSLQNVRGNLRIKGGDHLQVSRIGGNLGARVMSGGLSAEKVGGNAVLKGIGGAVAIEQVAGNLAARDLAAGAKVSRIGGNLALAGELGTGCTYHFLVDGNAALRLAEGANAHVTLTTKGHLVSSWDLADEVREGSTLSGTLGEGGAEVVVKAKGNVVLGGGSSEGARIRLEVSRQGWDELKSIDLDAISRQVEESLSAIDFEGITRQVNEEMEQAMSRLRVKLESMDWEQIGHRTQSAVERAMERIQRDMDRLTEKAARKQEQLERKAKHEARRLERMERKLARAAERKERVRVVVGVDDEGEPDSEWPIEEVEAVPEESVMAEPEQNLDEERLSILRMVERGQLSPSDAEMLLDALG